MEAARLVWAILHCVVLAQNAVTQRDGNQQAVIPESPFISSDRVTLVLFTSADANCSACRAFDGAWKDLKDAFKRVDTAEVDVSQPTGRTLASRFNASARDVPSLRLLMRAEGPAATIMNRGRASDSGADSGKMLRSAADVLHALQQRMAAASKASARAADDAAAANVADTAATAAAAAAAAKGHRLPAAWWPGRRRAGRSGLAPLPDAPVVKPRRYLLFDADPGEGFNFRKKLLHRVWALLRALRRAEAKAETEAEAETGAKSGAGTAKPAEWAIVVPKFRDRGSKTQYEPGVFFDVASLRAVYAADGRDADADGLLNFTDATGDAARAGTGAGGSAPDATRVGIGTLTAGEYIAHFGTTADASIFFRRDAGPPSEQAVAAACPDSQEDRRSDGYYLCDPSKPKGTASCYYSGSPFELPRHECYWHGGMHAQDPRLVDLVRRTVAAAARDKAKALAPGEHDDQQVTILLGGFDRISNVPIDGANRAARVARFWAERRFIRYAAPIEAAASTFLAQRFAGDATGTGHAPFIGLHLRRGDFEQHHKDTYNSAEQIVRMMAGLARRYWRRQALGGALRFFIATDAPSEVPVWQRHLVATVAADTELCAVGGKGGNSTASCPEVVLHTFTPPKGMRPMDAALVEQVIASRGVHFVGTFRSTFSLEIHYERTRLGFDWDEHDSSLSAGGELIHLCSDKHGEHCEGWVS